MILSKPSSKVVDSDTRRPYVRFQVEELVTIVAKRIKALREGEVAPAGCRGCCLRSVRPDGERDLRRLKEAWQLTSAGAGSGLDLEVLFQRVWRPEEGQQPATYNRNNTQITLTGVGWQVSTISTFVRYHVSQALSGGRF